MGLDDSQADIGLEEVEFHEPNSGKAEAEEATQSQPAPLSPEQEKAAQDSDMVMVFHIVSIVCGILSVIIFPIAEIIPAVMGCCMLSKIKKDIGDINIVLNLVNFIVTLCACLIYLMEVILIAIYTFGIGAILILFIIPFFFVLYDTIPGLKRLHLLQNNCFVQKATAAAQPQPQQQSSSPPGTIAVNYNEGNADNV